MCLSFLYLSHFAALIPAVKMKICCTYIHVCTLVYEFYFNFPTLVFPLPDESIYGEIAIFLMSTGSLWCRCFVLSVTFAVWSSGLFLFLPEKDITSSLL